MIPRQRVHEIQPEALHVNILNTERARLDKILSNNEVKALISVLGVGIGGILNHAMRTIQGVPPPLNWQGIIFSFGDTGFVRLEYRPEAHRWYLREFQSGG